MSTIKLRGGETYRGGLINKNYIQHTNAHNPNRHKVMIVTQQTSSSERLTRAILSHSSVCLLDAAILFISTVPLLFCFKLC